MSQYSHVTKKDYESVAGPDWPSYDCFQQDQDVPDFVYAEINQMLRPPQVFDHPSFCVLPFYGWEYPVDSPCCLWRGKFDLAQVQNQMLQGQRPSECQACWNLEDRGLKSDRQVKNETLDYYCDKNLKDLYEDCQQGKHQIVHYKIETNNVCNAACATCGSDNSTYWGKLLEKNQQPTTGIWQIEPHTMDQQINYVHARVISFRGGEPFLSKTNFYILKRLIEAGNTDCFITFQTNGSIVPTGQQLEILSHFKNINISFSLDGTGPVFEYLRYPLKWTDVENTIDWYRTRNFDISVAYTLSNLNVLYHAQTTAWFEKQNLNYLINQVYYPAWFRPSALPDSVKKSIDFDFVDSDEDLENYMTFRQKISEQDRWKGIRMQDYLPELWDLLG